MNSAGKPIVRDIMSPTLLYVREGDRVELARHPILDLGVTAVPVLDDEHRPVGVVSLRDLATGPARASTPAFSVLDTAPVDEAARSMAEGCYHHLVVVDAGGKAVGMLSVLDVVRSLAGLPAQHPIGRRRIERLETMA